jgi:flagellar hook-associated protein 1 FlgK
MSSSLIGIASSGLSAARAALDVTSQNIANASTDGYVRRTINLSSLSSVGMGSSYGDVSQFGVRVSSINREADSYLQTEVRRTNSDAARADTMVTGLSNISNALEDSNVYASIGTVISSMQSLTANPTDSSLRASLLENVRSMAQSFNSASTSLTSEISGMQTAATGSVSSVNDLAKSLAALNLRISSDNDPASNSASLLDERDQILQKLSTYGDISTTIASDNTVSVQMGGASGPMLVSMGTASTLAMTTNATTGKIAFTLGGRALTLAGGSLAGDQQVLSAASDTLSTLNTLASDTITTFNTQQANGAALDGTTGQPLLQGTTAATMGVALASGSGIATAKAGSAANSQDATNLTAMRAAINTLDPAGQANTLLFNVSSQVASAKTAQTALDAVSTNAKTQLAAQAGVSLDEEAANLIQYQQAYQASGKVISIAQTLFEQLLQI